MMQEKEKKIEQKRLWIYLLLSFGMAWLIFIGYYITGHKWDGEHPYLESLVGLGMLTPLLANVLTRFITKEGFAMIGKDSLMFGLNLKEKKWKYYLFAFFMPWIYIELSSVIFLLVVPEAFDSQSYKLMTDNLLVVFASPFICMSSGLIGSFAALGEEGGWRGYMMPKMISILGMKKAVIIGGIIWGLWHAPLTCIGHNFGTDYPGFPYVGILIMCLDCTFMGIMLTYITVQTNSIWPAAFMHAVNNQNPGILNFFIDMEKAEELMPFPLFNSVALLIPNIVIGSICLWLLIRKK